jgi:hypothetical protein
MPVPYSVTPNPHILRVDSENPFPRYTTTNTLKVSK